MFFGPIGKTRWPPWPLIGWDIFDFSSETAERNSTKLDRNQDHNALYQVCVFRADRKNKMAALASDWLRHFDFSSETAERNSTKLDRKQDLKALYQVCVFRADRKKQNGRPGLWLAETFSTSPLKPLNRIQKNLIGSKISKPSTKFVFFGPIGKTRWPPRPLIGWDIFDFSVETAERNSTKLDRKQDLNALYLVCVFRADGKNKMAALPLIGWDIFDFSSETAEQNSTKLDRKQDLNALYQVCVFRAERKKQNGRPGLWLAETFSTSLKKPLNRIQRNLTGSKLSMPSATFVFFRPIGKKQNGRPCLWFAETFSTSPQKPLNGIRQNLIGSKISRPSTKFVFFRWIGKQNGRPGLWFAETFSTFPLKPLNRIQQNLTGSKISTSSTRLEFFGLIRKTR